MNTETFKALNRLAKWRNLFAGWQLGTRSKGDPESDAVADHREATLMLRIEVNALIQLLYEKKIITNEEWDAAIRHEAVVYELALQNRFPGIKAADDGLVFDKRAIETMKGWKP